VWSLSAFTFLGKQRVFCCGNTCRLPHSQLVKLSLVFIEKGGEIGHDWVFIVQIPASFEEDLQNVGFSRIFTHYSTDTTIKFLLPSPTICKRVSRLKFNVNIFQRQILFLNLLANRSILLVFGPRLNRQTDMSASHLLTYSMVQSPS